MPTAVSSSSSRSNKGSLLGSNNKNNSFKMNNSRFLALLVAAAIYLSGLMSGLLVCSMTMVDVEQQQYPPPMTNKATTSKVTVKNNFSVAKQQKKKEDVASGVVVGSGKDRTEKRGEEDASSQQANEDEPQPNNSTTTNNNNHAQPEKRRGRRKRKKLKPHELKLPTPIMVMGLQKAGTTSIYAYFKCGLDGQLSHYDCKPGEDPDKIGMSCGKRLRRNVEKYSRPAFLEMDQFDLYAELDAQEKSGGMTLPQWEFVNEIHQHFPNATWILNLRNPRAWLNSVDRWKDLRQRFIDHRALPDFPAGKGEKDEEMIEFYELQAQRIRDFVKEHPSHTLVEVQIDSPEAGQVMEDAFGIPQKCWGNKNVNNGTAIWMPE